MSSKFERAHEIGDRLRARKPLRPRPDARCAHPHAASFPRARTAHSHRATHAHRHRARTLLASSLPAFLRWRGLGAGRKHRLLQLDVSKLVVVGDAEEEDGHERPTTRPTAIDDQRGDEGRKRGGGKDREETNGRVEGAAGESSDREGHREDHKPD